MMEAMNPAPYKVTVLSPWCSPKLAEKPRLGKGSIYPSPQYQLPCHRSSPTSITTQVGVAAVVKSLQLCPTLCDPMDCSLPGFSVHGILQARTLEWVAISFSNA